jgi:hypothetical protein
MRIRYRRTQTVNGYRADGIAYEVWTQDRPRRRWAHAGWVVPAGTSWIALPAQSWRGWTHYRRTRARAVQDMLAGRAWFNTGK